LTLRPAQVIDRLFAESALPDVYDALAQLVGGAAAEVDVVATLGDAVEHRAGWLVHERPRAESRVVVRFAVAAGTATYGLAFLPVSLAPRVSDDAAISADAAP
jgi:hypothetical protein